MENSEEMKKTHEKKPKHLGFVRVAAIKTIVWLTSVYDYAKMNCGPLRSTVGTVEGAVTTVITPVYTKFKNVPDHFLSFLDDKVDVASAEFDQNASPLAKQVVSQVHGLIKKAAQVTKELIHQAQVGGPLEAACYIASESKDLVLDSSVKVWSKLDQLPPFHMVAEMTVPTAAHFSEKYNNLITNLRGKGYVIFSYVPLVPVDELAKAFEQSQAASKGEPANQPATSVASQ